MVLFHLSKRSKELLASRARDILIHRKPVSSVELADRLKLSRSTVYRQLLKLSKGEIEPNAKIGVILPLLQAIAPKVLSELTITNSVSVQDYAIPESRWGELPEKVILPPLKRRIVFPQQTSGSLIALEEYPSPPGWVHLLLVKKDASPAPGQERVVVGPLGLNIVRQRPPEPGEELVGVVVERFSVCRCLEGEDQDPS